MSVTSGFFNSFNGDRKYNAEQMSAIFDGIINDGIFASVGTAFEVTATTGATVNVGIGRAWFNSTWLLNDSILPISLDISEVVLNRIDAVVIEINRAESVRNGFIKVVKGTPAGEPSRPTMVNSVDVHQYPLAYIYRAGGSATITQADITSMIGSDSCPYVTGILSVVSIESVVAQWKAQWEQWFATTTENSEEETIAWQAQAKAEFNAWFEALEVTLDENVAATLETQIIDLQDRFNVLLTEGSIYDDLKDSSGQNILDSYNSVIEAKTVLASSGGSSGGIANDEQLQNIMDEINGKQDRLIGTPGYVAGFDDNGSLVSINARPKRVNVTLPSTAWANMSQTVLVPGISANEEEQLIQVIPASVSKGLWKQYGIEATSQDADSLTFSAKSTPAENISVYVVVQEVIS